MVTTTFYPHAVVGSVRASNWSRMLPGLGWKPLVFCRWYGVAATRAMLDEKVHPACDVVYVDGPWAWMGQAERDRKSLSAVSAGSPTGSGPRWKTWKRWGKRWVSTTALAKLALVPDVSVVFWRGVAARLRGAIEGARAEMMVTCSPPHSVHQVGFGVRDVPWVLDFQDPHLMDVRYGPRGLAGLVTSEKHLAFKERCNGEASAMVHANALHDRWVRMRFPAARHKCHLLEPVCPEDLASGRVEPALTAGGRRSVRVVGFIGEEEAVSLARAVRELVDGAPGGRAGERSAADIEVRFVGKMPGTAERIRALLGDRVVFTGALVHDEAKRQIQGADLLVSYLSPYRSSYNGISSKLFEFVAARKPVIQINPTAPDRHLLRRLRTIQVLEAPSTGDLSRAIEKGLSAASAEEAREAPEVEAFVRGHSWDRHAEALGRVLEAAEREWGGEASASRRLATNGVG